jgi:Fur family iron response transcriptional regulator
MNKHSHSHLKSTQNIADMLFEKNLRPTRQRMALCRLLFSEGDRHVTAEELHKEAKETGTSLSLATVYNTLHQLREVGLLAEVSTPNNKIWFDTNISPHHHFLSSETGELTDVPADEVSLSKLPAPPSGSTIKNFSVFFNTTVEA